LQAPASAVPGSRMPFAGDSQRADLIACLDTLK